MRGVTTARAIVQLIVVALLIGLGGSARAQGISSFRLNPRGRIVDGKLQVQARVQHQNQFGQGTAEFFAHLGPPAHSEAAVRAGVPLRLAGQAAPQPIPLKDGVNNLTLEVDLGRLRAALALTRGATVCIGCYFDLDAGREAERRVSHEKFGTPLKSYHIYGSTDPKTNPEWTQLALP